MLLLLGANDSPSPANIARANLWAWYDFSDTSTITDAGGGAVSAVADKSGNGRNASQSSAGARPTTGATTINGRNVLDLGASANTYLDVPTPSGLSAAQVILIMKNAADPGSTADSGLWVFGSYSSDDHYPFTDGNVYNGFGSTARKNCGNPTPPLTNTHMLSVVTASGEWTAYVNGGTPLFTTATNSVGFSASTKLGSSFSISKYVGSMCEFILYDRKLTAVEMNALGAYAASKWGFTYSNV